LPKVKRTAYLTYDQGQDIPLLRHPCVAPGFAQVFKNTGFPTLHNFSCPKLYLNWSENGYFPTNSKTG